jgi:hypothetical protein
MCTVVGGTTKLAASDTHLCLQLLSFCSLVTFLESGGEAAVAGVYCG